jgi:hypothetical protein
MSRRLFLLVFALAGAGLLARGAGDGAEKPSRTFLYDENDLLRAQKRAAAGDPAAAAAVKALRARADRALKEGPFSVVHPRPRKPPSGDPHDYMSQAPYWWPDPKKPDGLPYIRRDGQTNPEVNKFDRPLLGKMTSAVGTLAQAYRLTGDERYAAHAARLVRAWFLDPATRMNPNLNYGQFVPGRNDGRGTGIIESRNFLTVVDAVGLLRDSPAWTKADQAGLEEWFRRFLHWLQTSAPGKEEAAATNNHGSWYDVQVVTFALFSGDRKTAKAVLEQVGAKRIARQIEPDGRQPRELKRTKSFGYSVFNLEALVHLAALGERLGVELWHYRTEDGRSLRKALDWLLPYALGEKEWPYPQLGKLQADGLAPLLRRAANAYREPRYEQALARLPQADRRREALELLYPARR